MSEQTDIRSKIEALLKSEPMTGYVVLDEAEDGMGHWYGSIAYPNPEGANLYWEKPEPFVERKEYEKLKALVRASVGLVEALDYVIKSEPTKKNGEFCEINQPQFNRAKVMLAAFTAEVERVK